MSQAFAGAFGSLHESGGAGHGGLALRAERQGWLSASASVATSEGGVPMGWLREGDMVRTRDNGFQPVLKVLRRDPGPEEGAANPAHWPVRIEAGVLGAEAPYGPLTLSPWQRVLLIRPELELLFGFSEAFVTARHLVGWPGVSRVEPDPEAVQFHLLFERHEAILADGTWMESFLIDEPEAPAITAMGPLLAEALKAGHARLVRPELKAWEVTLLSPPGMAGVEAVLQQIR